MFKVNGKPVVILPSFAPLYVTAAICKEINGLYYVMHKMFHHGVDYVSTHAFDVIAVGDGVIKAAGIEPKIKGKDGLWGVVALTLDPFYHPLTGSVVKGVARYFHMYEVYVKTGQRVKQGDVIGRCITAADDPQNLYPGGHHLHFECGSSSLYSLLNPNRSPQVAGGKYIKAGADFTVNPNTWLYIAPGQSIALHPDATMVSASDLITRRVI